MDGGSDVWSSDKKTTISLIQVSLQRKMMFYKKKFKATKLIKPLLDTTFI